LGITIEKMSKTRVLLLAAHIISLALFWPGISKDMLQVDITARFIIEFNLFNESRSILGTLGKLWESGNDLPFFLILFFGIVIPLLKSVFIFMVLLSKNPQPFYVAFVNAISKWAMADVFAISIFVAFLGANAMNNTKAVLQDGFYWFSAYVLLSAAIGWLLTRMVKNQLLNKT
jgi:paraquat-inducible protein A